MLEVVLMFCFPIIEDIKGHIRISPDFVSMPVTYTHGKILASLNLNDDGIDSYICSKKMIEGKIVGTPNKAGDGGWSWEL